MSPDPLRVDRVRQAVEARRDELIELLIEFCSIPAENPPGSHLTESQQWIRATLDRYGIAHATHHTSASNADHCVIIGEMGDSGSSVYLHGHYDVVPAFSPDQFTPTVANDVVYGRGTSDMKSGLVTMLLGALVHRDLDGRGRIRLIYVPDEETGGANGSERLVELGLVDATGCLGAIVGEPSYPDIWYAARGAFTVRVTVHGRPAHVGLHYGGDNAFEHAHDVVAALRRYRNKVSGHRTALTIEPEAARDSIMLIGGLSEGGTNFNIVPDRFSFTVDRRPNPDEDYAAARQELLDLLAELGSEHRISVEVLQDARPALPDTDGGLTGVLQSAVQAASGRHAPLSMCPGCLETRIYSALGIPAVAYGPGPMAQMHAPDERVPITNLLEAATVYALTLGELVGHG